MFEQNFSPVSSLCCAVLLNKLNYIAMVTCADE